MQCFLLQYSELITAVASQIVYGGINTLKPIDVTLLLRWWSVRTHKFAVVKTKKHIPLCSPQ
jgi:hypothetical protein